MPQALRLVSYICAQLSAPLLPNRLVATRGELPVDAGRREARERADQEQGQRTG